MRKPTKLFLSLKTGDIKDHRYASIDDYFDPIIHNEDALIFRTTVGNMGNTDYEFLVFIHAITEQYLCYKHKVKDAEITKFDMDNPQLDDPGNDPKAPYHLEHMVANDIEATLSVALGVDWKKYEDAIEKTLKKFPKKKV